MRAIDLNCDLGEGAGNDAALMPLIASANIACGAHAGDAATMLATVELALQYDVAMGAHPGFPDRAHFGRRELAATPAQVGEWVRDQTETLMRIAHAAGARLRHVKPHGALYNMAARDAVLADAVAAAVKACDAHLALVGLSGSELPAAGLRAGLRVAHEVFADRAYHQDGSLVARGAPRALIDSPKTAVERMVQLLQTEKINSIEGRDIALKADTICLHGDGIQPVEFARELRQALIAAQISIRPLVV